jgi:hypothetical protein
VAKIGRPKGSPNKPKWLKKLEARRPKRPRGRPKGSKNKPKTLEAFLAASLNADAKPPELLPKPKGPPRYDGSAKLNSVPPEVRSARARAAAKARWEKHPEKEVAPKGWTLDQYRLFLEDAKREAQRIFTIMADEGRAPDDPLAQEAMKAVLSLMQSKNPQTKLRAARTVLEYTKAKPAAKHDHTIRTAEDFLDDLASQEADGDE